MPSLYVTVREAI